MLTLSLQSFGCLQTTSEIKTGPKKAITNNTSCLELIDTEDLQKSLDICNTIIEKYPDNPEPLSDRSLIFTLKGETHLACEDIKNALDIINTKEKIIDPLIKYQITIRYDSCKKL